MGRELSWSACLLQKNFPKELSVEDLNNQYRTMGGATGDQEAIKNAEKDFLIGKFLTDDIITQYLKNITEHKDG